MRTRTLTLLTVANTAVLALLLLGTTAPASSGSDRDVLRGSALEIVDARGRVRASIKVQPAGASDVPGRRYPETVMLRLVDENGRPEVKIGASTEGGGFSLIGDNDATQVLVQARGAESSIRLANRDGRRQVLGP